MENNFSLRKERYININKKGNSVIIFICIVSVIIVLFFFLMAVYISQINSILYNIKLDMYSINKSAIVSINKGVTSREKISYDKKVYEEYFKDLLKKNYNLDNNMKNDEALIEEVEILDYDICESGKKDNYTKTKFKDTTIHSVIRVKMKPIFMREVLKDMFTFELHEDVVLNKFKV